MRKGRADGLQAKVRIKVSVSMCAGASCLLVLACGASVVRGEGIVPVEGGWVATTSAGLPVSFEVKEGNVLNAHFRFNWGFCGTYESHLPNTDPIDADGHWSFLDSRGQTIEGTFVAPDRVEGTVDAAERELPGCPHTRATFVAAPGEIPPHVKPECSRCRTQRPVTYSVVRYALQEPLPRSFAHHGFRIVR